MSAGIGLTAVLSGFINQRLNQHKQLLFGSIVAITDFELYLTIELGIAVIITQYYCIKNCSSLRLTKRRQSLGECLSAVFNLVLMLLTAVTVSVCVKIGALMISSLLVIPVAAAMMIAKSYKQTIWWSIAFAGFHCCRTIHIVLS